MNKKVENIINEIKSLNESELKEMNLLLEKYKKEEGEADKRIQKIEDRDNEILSSLGVTTEDFCRFRNVWIEEDRIFVETRDAGGGCISGDAIKKAAEYYLDSYDDDFDSTYTYYIFKNPNKEN